MSRRAPRWKFGLLAIACLLTHASLPLPAAARSSAGVPAFGKELPPELSYFRSAIEGHVVTAGRVPRLGPCLARFDGANWVPLYRGPLPESIFALSDQPDGSAYVLGAKLNRTGVTLYRCTIAGLTELATLEFRDSVREGIDAVTAPENFIFCADGDVWILSDARRVVYWHSRTKKVETINLVKTIPSLRDAGGATLPDQFALPFSGLHAGDGRLWLWTKHLNWRAPPDKRGVVLMREAKGANFLPPDYLGLKTTPVSEIFPAQDGGVWIAADRVDGQTRSRLWHLPRGGTRLGEIELPAGLDVVSLVDLGAKQLCVLASGRDRQTWLRKGATWIKFDDAQARSPTFPQAWGIHDGYVLTGWAGEQGLVGYPVEGAGKTEIRRWDRQVGLILPAPDGVLPLKGGRFVFFAQRREAVLFESADLARRPPEEILATRDTNWAEGPLPDGAGGIWFALRNSSHLVYAYHAPGSKHPEVWSIPELPPSNDPAHLTPMFDNRDRFWLLTGNQEDALLCFEPAGKFTRHPNARAAWPGLIAEGLRFRPARLVGNVSAVPAVSNDGRILALDRPDVPKPKGGPDVHLYDGNGWRATPLREAVEYNRPQYAAWSEEGLPRIGFLDSRGVELRERGWILASFAEAPPIACRNHAEYLRQPPDSITIRLPGPVQGYARDETGVLWISAGNRLWRGLGERVVPVLPADQPLPVDPGFRAMHTCADGTRYFIPEPGAAPWRIAPLSVSSPTLKAVQLESPDESLAITLKTEVPKGGLLQWRHADGPWSEIEANPTFTLPELPAGPQPITLRAWDASLNYIGSAALSVAAPDRSAGAKLRVRRLREAKDADRTAAVHEIKLWGETCRPWLHELQAATNAEDELMFWIRAALQALDDRQRRVTEAAAAKTR